MKTNTVQNQYDHSLTTVLLTNYINFTTISAATSE